MKLLLPLGLLGLLSVAALILIYVIKPNYQKKFVSSTYVWKKSLKYKKKSLPINKIRNILLFICQLCILAACAFLLAQPVLSAEKENAGSEKVVIIDASASMMVKQTDETRFERAVSEVRDFARTTAERGGVLSVIVADSAPYFLVQRSAAYDLEEVYDRLDELVSPEAFKCSYGSADMEEAANLADLVLQENPTSEVIFYTATDYIDKGNFKVVNVAEEGEWNVAILNCSAVLKENVYTFAVEAGCFGSTRPVTVYCEISNVNNSDKTLTMSKTELFDVAEQKKTIEFTPEDQIDFGGESVYSYERVYVHVEEEDSLDIDNSYYLYGGVKPVIKIQYISSVPNKFFTGVLLNMRASYKTKWDIVIDEVTVTENTVYETRGYDFYIFEHVMPSALPTDGAVLMVNPDKVPQNLNMRIDSVAEVDETTTLTAGAEHETMRFITPSDITVSRYVKFAEYDGFEELMYCGTDPVLLIKNNAEAKVAVLAFSLNQSNFGVLFDFPFWMNNLFNYFIPTTTSGYTFEVGDSITVNSRSSSLSVEGPSVKYEYTEFPARLTLTRPGTYTLRQTTMTDDYLTETIYASISNFESEITKQVDALPTLHVVRTTGEEDRDLIVYLAAALLALLFLEWFLQSRDNL